MKKLILVVLFFMCASSIFSQHKLNAYKAVVIPYKFSFSSVDNEYRLNTRFRYLLKEKGFKVYFESELLSKNVIIDKCDLLFADINLKETMLRTEMFVVFNDCNNALVYSTQKGISKYKEYDKAYQDALKKAMYSLTSYNYNYDDGMETATKSVVAKEEPKEVVYYFNNKEIVLKPDSNSKVDFLIEKEGNQVGFLKKSTLSKVYHIKFNDNFGLAFFNVEDNLEIELMDNSGIVDKLMFNLKK